MEAFHIAIWPTSRDSRDRMVGASSTPSTDRTIVVSSCSSLSPLATSIILPTAKTWWSNIVVTSSMSPSLLRAGSWSHPGGWKWTSFGAGSRRGVGWRRHSLGGSPYARVNARVHAPRCFFAVRGGEWAGERLVGGRPGLGGEIEPGSIRGGQTVRGPLEEHP